MVYYSEKQGACYLGQLSFLDRRYDHQATQNQNIAHHTWHTVGPIAKCTAGIPHANIYGTNTSGCLDMGVAGTKGG